MPLLLPETFAFSQSSLQAFTDCARRFWLAYVQQLDWPAEQVAPYSEHETRMRQGNLFHQLVERTEEGLSPAQVSANLEPPLDQWYAAYLESRPADLPTDFMEIEHVLSIPFGPYRLAARYDLIAGSTQGPTVILDWKTGVRRTEAHHLARRLQSVVYPYVLVEAGASLPWGPVAPEQVQLRYWFTAAPLDPVIFSTNAALHATNRERLDGLLADLLSRQTEADFPQVADTENNRRRLCAYCIYRSRCNRGEVAGEIDLIDDEEIFLPDLENALEFTLEDVAELVF